jgi:hypothetical protein
MDSVTQDGNEEFPVGFRSAIPVPVEGGGIFLVPVPAKSIEGHLILIPVPRGELTGN